MSTKDNTSGILPSYARSVDEGLILRLKVVPGARCEEVVGAYGDRLKVRVSAPPEGGKANKVVEKIVATWARAKRAQIINGAHSAEKEILLQGVTTLPTN